MGPIFSSRSPVILLAYCAYVVMFMTRRRLLSVFLLVCVYFLFSLLKGSASSVPNEPHGRAIISLASSHHRLDDELPVTIRSLTRQTVSPQEIRIYMPESDRELVEERHTRSAPGVKSLSSWLLHPSVKILFVEDFGPATKFIHVLGDLMDQHDQGDHDVLDQPVIIVGKLRRLIPDAGGSNRLFTMEDDDHAYSSQLVSTLMSAHATRASISVGFRGWRIRYA